MKAFAVLFFVFILGIHSFANSPKEIPAGGIPLPGQLSYTGEGIQIGLALGMIQPLSGDDEFLAAWSGAFEYFYASFLSGGGNVWIYGGDLDSETMILYARYQVHVRFHYMVNSRVSLYFSPMMWFENTEIDEIQEDISGKDDEYIDEDAGDKKAYELAPEQRGFAIAGELGFGVRLIGGLGFVGSSSIEKSFLTSSLLNFSAGFSYDIRQHFRFLQENFLGMHLSFETTFRRFLDSDWDNYANYWVLGLNLSF